MPQFQEKVILTIDDFRKLNHNLGSDDAFSNYDLSEISTLNFGDLIFTSNWQGKKVECFELYSSFTECPFKVAIKIDGEIKHLIAIDDWVDCLYHEKRGLITAFGCDRIVQLWLDDGEFYWYIR